MTTLPPNPGPSGLAAREAAASTESGHRAPKGRAPDFLDVWGRLTTTPAEVTRAADDDADHKRSDFTRPPRPVCGCCGPQQCCCTCHKEES